MAYSITFGEQRIRAGLIILLYTLAGRFCFLDCKLGKSVALAAIA
jgi:hypothetical protein